MNPEAEFLRERVRLAKQRMHRTTTEIVNGVLVPLEARPLVRRHPWTSLGVALLGGIVTGAGLRRGRSRRAAERADDGFFDRIARTLHRGGRILRSTLGAMVLTNLRDSARAATKTNGVPPAT